MKLSPLHDWAVIRPSEAEEMTESGLYIPDTAKDKPSEGIVVAIGPGAYEEEKDRKKKEEKKERRFIPTTIKPGDRVLYERFAGQTYTVDNEELVLVREREILGILPAQQEKERVKPKALQIPAVTTSPITTSIVKRPTFPIAKTPARTEIQKPAEKIKKKAAGKKSAKKKSAKKAVKKASKKTVKKAVKKNVKQATKRPNPRPSKSKKAKRKN
jgi:chaperonin GroES